MNDKPTLNLIVMGHVDSGKSTLIGSLLDRLGLIPQKVMHKQKTEFLKHGKGSSYLAWTTDDTNEERERGVTIDITNECFTSEKYKINIIDSPGHKDFISNMITGATQADAAILVIDAIVGAFESGFGDTGQTKEHTLIARYLGISQLIVAINKMDSCAWNVTRYDQIVDNIRSFLRKSNFKESDVHFVPICATQGINLDGKNLPPITWYTGKPLIPTLDLLQLPERNLLNPLRISLSSTYKVRPKKYKIYGRIEAGTLETNEELLCYPLNQKLLVKSIFVSEEVVPKATAGNQIAMDVELNSDEEISIGSILSSKTSPCLFSSRLATKIIFFTMKRPLIIGSEVIMHLLQQSVPVKIKKILKSTSKSTKDIKLFPRLITSDSTCEVELQSELPFPFDLFDNIKCMGRFILRDKSSVIGVGIITSLPNS